MTSLWSLFEHRTEVFAPQGINEGVAQALVRYAACLAQQVDLLNNNMLVVFFCFWNRVQYDVKYVQKMMIMCKYWYWYWSWTFTIHFDIVRYSHHWYWYLYNTKMFLNDIVICSPSRGDVQWGQQLWSGLRHGGHQRLARGSRETARGFGRMAAVEVSAEIRSEFCCFKVVCVPSGKETEIL